MIAAIQAGGRSTRMKTDKAWLMINDQPMIEHVLRTAQQVTEKIIVVVNKNTPRASDYQNLAAKYKATILLDAHDFRGPLGGIQTALIQAQKEDPLLILACDLPFVSVEFLQLLISIHQSNPALLTIPTDVSMRPQMLCAIYTKACLNEINGMLAANILKTRLLSDRVATNFVSIKKYSHLPGAEKFLMNLNTPEEYQLVDSN
jgi:molybdopterin-guanine dinucleotide biosynthesis protein A